MEIRVYYTLATILVHLQSLFRDAKDEGEARGQAPITKIHRNRFCILLFFYIPHRVPAESRVWKPTPTPTCYFVKTKPCENYRNHASSSSCSLSLPLFSPVPSPPSFHPLPLFHSSPLFFFYNFTEITRKIIELLCDKS